jgi:hypothetical protein
MRTKLPVDSFEYLMDFVYVKVKEVWPDAVVLDHRADVRFGRAKAYSTCEYGFDIFRSEAEVELLLSGDCCPPPPNVNVSWADGVAHVSGDAGAVRYLADQALWKSA